MTFTVAARTSVQSTTFDTVSMVPSIKRACTTLPTTVMATREVWARRQVRGRSGSRRRSAAKSAAMKTAHMAMTPQAENGVGDLKKRASTTSGGLVIQSAATWVTTASTRRLPVQRCRDRLRETGKPGKYPPASKAE